MLGYLFLSQVILMLLLVTWLFIETQRAVRREIKLFGKVRHTLRRERCTYAVITTFFALSYVGRFLLNVFEDSCRREASGSIYVQLMTQIIVYLLEGVSLGVLMLFHLINFKHGSLMTKS